MSQRQAGRLRLVVQVTVASLVGLVALFAALRQRRRRRLPARAVIISSPHATVVARDGAVHSAQTAELTMKLEDLERLWNPSNLENLGRTYWRFLSRVTLGLIRVVYGTNERRVVFLGRPVTLLRFEAPEYVLERDHGLVRWRIRDGLLVARRGRGSGYLALDVQREVAAESDGQGRLRIEIKVANFYPSIAASFSTPVYEATQSAIHVLVTHSFLRSLATLSLAHSKVGMLAGIGDAAAANGSPVADAGERAELGAVVASGDPPHSS